MTSFTTKVMETLINQGNFDELFCRHLEYGINPLLSVVLTAFLDYEK